MRTVAGFLSREQRNRHLVDVGIAVDEATADLILDADPATEELEAEDWLISLEQIWGVERGDDTTG